MSRVEPRPPLETWVTGPIPKAKGETLYVLRHELKGVCADVEGLKGIRKPLPWYFVLASGGASLALAGGLGLLAYIGAPHKQKPPHWIVYAYGSMFLVGLTAAIILFIVGLLSKSSYDQEIDAITGRIRGMEYEADK